MAKKYLDDAGVLYFWGKLKAYFQPMLVSGTNIKTINSTSLLGSGDLTIPSVGTGIIEFDETASSGTTDGDLYALISAYGWTDCIVETPTTENGVIEFNDSASSGTTDGDLCALLVNRGWTDCIV